DLAFHRGELEVREEAHRVADREARHVDDAAAADADEPRLAAETRALARRARAVGDEPLELVAKPARAGRLLATLQERDDARERSAHRASGARELHVLLAGALEQDAAHRRGQVLVRR